MPIRKRAQSKSTRKSLHLFSSKLVFDGAVFSVSSDKVQEPNGVVARRDVVHHSGSVVILAIDETGHEPRVLLERQYRYAARDYLWELPAGSLDPSEKPLAAGKRELMEETGYRARQWKRALHFFPSPGFLDEVMTIYLARGLTAGKAQPEADERIAYQLVPLAKTIEMILSGKIRDGKTIAGVLWLAESLRRNQL
ncbi:MAG: NUDIX domain-containing protein [Candidatus Korobacteraceae bacterium]|jgi:ADP-ribose pyrophosphatase